MDIQKILKQLNTKMTDAQIGKAVGIPQPTINRLRNGVHKRTYHDRWEAIKRLAEAHGLLPDER